MEYILNSSEMKQCDKNTIEYFGVPSMVLMERAALAVFEEIKRIFPKKNEKILVLCGMGNNGGDGFAIARLLHLANYKVEILFPMDITKMTEECHRQYDIIKKYDISIYESLSEFSYDVIVDSLFGIGLCRPIQGKLAKIIDACNQTDAFRIAVDIPSGISADTGEILGMAFKANLTISFGFGKIGQFLYPGAQYCGTLVVADIGIDKNSLLGYIPNGSILTATDILQMLPKRIQYSNKGSYGKVVIIAGSKNMAGAAYLAAKAAYYAGCGLVRILTAEENRSILLTKLPEAIITTYSNKGLSEENIIECLDWADSILIGPGIGTGAIAEKLLETVLKKRHKPLILDADALNIISKKQEWMTYLNEDCIITPHLGEMSRLTGMPIEKIQKNLIMTANEYAVKHGITCVLKDARTIVAKPDGTYYINITGNNGMATGGSGDVLAGLLTGILAQVSEGKRQNIASLVCYIHGMAGDKAKDKKGAYSMIASDILEEIPTVLAGIIWE